MNNKLISFFKFFIGWPVSLVAVFFIVKLVLSNSNLIIPYLKTPTWPLLGGGIICFFIYYLLRTFLWQDFLRKKGHKFSYKEAAYFWAAAELKRYAPGNIWSFIGKTLSLHERGIDKKTTARLIFFEIGFFLISCLILSLLASNFLFSGVLPNLFKYFSGLTTILVAAIAIIYICANSLLGKSNNKLSNLMRFFLPDFSIYQNFIYLTTTMFLLFLYGLGYFLTVASVVYLPLENTLSLIGFFVFSLFVGYVSIITPMGLGVREGVITLGLTSFLGVGLAAFSSIFARISLIFTELVFVSFIFVYRNLKSEVIGKIEKFISVNSHLIILCTLVLLYISYFTTISFLRYDNFFTGRFDLGNMDQTVWNTINGRIFQLTDPHGTEVVSRLSFHADFILILISPLYFIWENPKILLLLQSAVLGLGAFFIYLISKDILKNKNISLIFSLSYLLNPSVGFSNLYDFHPVTLATTFLLASFYFVRKNKYFWFFVFLFLSVLCKEEIWAIAGIFGLYIFFVKNKKLLGTGLTIFALSMFYYIIAYLIPNVRGSEHFALEYYSDFGDSPISIIKNFFLNPLKTASIIAGKDPFLYLYKLFLPVGFSSFVFPIALVFAAPDFFINLLSSNSQFRDLYYQYTATITPFVYISAIYSVYLLTKKIPKIPLSLYQWYIVIFTLLSVYLLSPLPFSKSPSLSVFTQQLAAREEIAEFLRRIPKQYSIAASNNLGSHLSKRQFIYTIPVGLDKADIIIFLLNDNFAQPSLPDQKKLASSLKKNNKYRLIIEKGDFMAFERI